MKLSVVLATYNEEKNISDCLQSVKELADEIIIVDGASSDKTVEIARSFGAKVTVTDNPQMFHINKQKALGLAKREWILQLDADERVSKKLAEEIKKIITMDDNAIEEYQQKLRNRKLFLRHQKIIEERDGAVGERDGEYAAFFVPRLNYFLGKYLRYGGVYPDGVIRLVKKEKAFFPCKSVHEQIAVKGKVGWLQNDLLHMADPTFNRYLMRNSRYIDLIVSEFKKDKTGKNPLQFVDYVLFKPLWWYLLTQIRHKGLLDGFPGIVFSFFSALRFPRAYWRYLVSK
ncbi:MAG: glycosyltransferase family 2 protein [Patescibacteria group bacterium]|nr:glycosyltransferase family 2 protein [Patescibacteria group bacterium]